MDWVKKGLIYSTDGTRNWSRSHAQVPVVDCVDDDTWRIYYSTRNGNGKSLISYIEVDSKDPAKILYIHNEPVMDFGDTGTFDEDGLMPSYILNVGAKKYLYYIGWSVKKNVPYQNSIGLAISDDGGKTFKKYSEGPVIGIDAVDPYFTGTICVIKDGDIYKAYYLSCTGWKLVDGKQEATYILKYAESKDALSWKKENKTAIGHKNEEEGGIVSATVVKINEKYLMWFGYRHFFDFRTNPEHSYKIGFAESADGINWNRDDSKAGISLSKKGWDSQMISYPYVIEQPKSLFMFYNGNGFGKTGFGYAELKY